jgi:hypothetical protein
MPQLIENKQNHPILIANFEPNEIATKSGQKTKVQTRKHCADKPALRGWQVILGWQARRFSRAGQRSEGTD